MDTSDFRYLFYAALLLFALLASYAAGILLRAVLPQHHRSQEARETLYAVIAALVTFTALVLGLMVTSAKESFDAVEKSTAVYARQVVEIDRLLMQLGPEVAEARRALHDYTQLAVSTFSSPEAQDDTKILLLGRVEDSVRHLHTTGGTAVRLQSEILARMSNLTRARADIVFASGVSTTPFYAVLVIWFLATFFTFGLNASPNALIIVSVLLLALSVSSAMFVVLDMQTPLTGIIAISDQPLRHALTKMGAS